MASKPYEPPESIVLDQFLGLNNVRSPERLAMGELSIARNVILDDARQMRSRQGMVRDDAASYHSFCNIAGRAFIVKNGVLGTLSAALGFSPLTTVGSDPLSYTSVSDTVYASSISWSGQISGSNVVSVWGQASPTARWVSPVMTPTDTLGQISGRRLSAPPFSSLIEEHNGRIYLAIGSMLWVTELYLYSQVDRDKNFIQFEHPITMLYSGGGGLYVGTTEELYFLPGTFAQGMKIDTVMDAGVIPGSLVEIPAPMVHPGAGSQLIPEGFVPVFTTTAGICVGLAGGEVHNLTQGRVEFSGLTQAAALHRADPGNSQYIVADAGGSAWSLNTRTKTVTELTNYTFNGFGRVGDSWYGCAPNGLYELTGPDDLGNPIPVRVRSGLMRFGGTRLSRLKSAYVTARSVGLLEMTIETGEGVEYVYEVTPYEMRTTRIHMGKGQRATHFLFDISADSLDLDVLELVPIVVQRRV